MAQRTISDLTDRLPTRGQTKTSRVAAATVVSTSRHSWVILLFATTSFVGASLLFVVQPLVARLVLPHYGGSATVWSTSNLFFQVVLLAGYFYAHAITRKFGPRIQPLIHIAILMLPLVGLPVALVPDAAPTPEASPILWLLRTLLLVVGLPFAVISTTGPLLQRWYSWTDQRRSGDPYFLYATSNLGSFTGLLAYPFLVEPFLTLDQQRISWSWAFGAFLILMLTCGVVTIHNRAPQTTAVTASITPLTVRQVTLWLFLAFIPSSLMLGVTSHISTDIAAIPLMWVVPLAIYLATFVIAFARSGRKPSPRSRYLAAVLAAVAAVTYNVGNWPFVGIPIAIDLALLTIVAYAAHSTLAAARPAPSQLTSFYLVVSAGGALGGLLNGLLAPALFDRVWEYPAIIVASALLAVGTGRESVWLRRRYDTRFVWFLEAAIAALALLAFKAGTFAMSGSPWVVVALTATFVGACFIARRPAPLAAGLAIILFGLALSGPETLYRERTFYGSYKVTEQDGVRKFTHGTTLHGSQSIGANELSPTSYYARSGPVGDIFREYESRDNVAIVGLGVGTIAAYGTPGQTFTFYEIDPKVVDIARDPELFTFLSNSAAEVRTVIGDGRLRLAEAAAGSYDMLILDAFSSDSIPVHLLTQEAFEIYADTLAPDGILMVHVSNRIFNLEPVIAASGEHINWTVAAGFGEGDQEQATPSEWIALTRSEEDLEPLLGLDNWRWAHKESLVWTDNYSSVLTALR